MDPESNHGGTAPHSGDDSPTVAPVSTETASPRDVPAPIEAPQPQPEAVAPAPAPAPKKKSSRTRPKAGTHPNNVRKLRQGAMMSKAELARRAGVSPLTIDRVEAGCPCRMDTKRKILEALGLQPSAAREVFPDLDLQA